MNVYMHQNHKAKKEKRKKGSLLVRRRDVNYRSNIIRIRIHIRMYVNKGKRNYSRKKKKKSYQVSYRIKFVAYIPYTR